MDYRTLAQVTEPQWPIVGGPDLYFGGTAYDNKQGLGQQTATAAESGALDGFDLPADTPATTAPRRVGAINVLRTPALYTPGTLINLTPVLRDRHGPADAVHQPRRRRRAAHRRRRGEPVVMGGEERDGHGRSSSVKTRRSGWGCCAARAATAPVGPDGRRPPARALPSRSRPNQYAPRDDRSSETCQVRANPE
jgi:hypothetical protein